MRWKHSHESWSPYEKRYNSLLSACTRANGGWRNWRMVLVELFPCEHKHEKEARLHYWVEQLKPTLNHKPGPKEYDEYVKTWAKNGKRGARPRKPKAGNYESDEEPAEPLNFELRF